MVDITRVKGSFENLARSNRFRVTGFGLDENLEFFAQSSSLPASNIGTVEVPYQGRVIKIPGDRTFDEWTITVRDDNNATNRRAFEDWMAEANETISNVGLNAVEGIKREGQIILMDRAGNDIIEYSIIGAWPSSVGELSVSWDENDSIATFDVTLQYDFFQRTG